MSGLAAGRVARGGHRRGCPPGRRAVVYRPGTAPRRGMLV